MVGNRQSYKEKQGRRKRSRARGRTRRKTGKRGIRRRGSALSAGSLPCRSEWAAFINSIGADLILNIFYKATNGKKQIVIITCGSGGVCREDEKEKKDGQTYGWSWTSASLIYGCRNSDTERHSDLPEVRIFRTKTSLPDSAFFSSFHPQGEVGLIEKYLQEQICLEPNKRKQFYNVGFVE